MSAFKFCTKPSFEQLVSDGQTAREFHLHFQSKCPLVKVVYAVVCSTYSFSTCACSLILMSPSITSISRNSGWSSFFFLLSFLFFTPVPSTIHPLQNKTITEGGNLNLSCNTSGTPPPVVSWVRISTGQRFDGSVLQLISINRSEARDYRCEASNECGNASEVQDIDIQCK